MMYGMQIYSPPQKKSPQKTSVKYVLMDLTDNNWFTKTNKNGYCLLNFSKVNIFL